MLVDGSIECLVSLLSVIALLTVAVGGDGLISSILREDGSTEGVDLLHVRGG